MEETINIHRNELAGDAVLLCHVMGAIKSRSIQGSMKVGTIRRFWCWLQCDRMRRPFRRYNGAQNNTHDLLPLFGEAALWGASIYDVRTEGGVSPKEDVVREVV